MTDRLFLEVVFMQTQHASPLDYYRWTSGGLRQLSWMDWWLERHPMAHRTASAFAILALKPSDENHPQENHAAR
jgi:hypothetical protein